MACVSLFAFLKIMKSMDSSVVLSMRSTLSFYLSICCVTIQAYDGDHIAAHCVASSQNNVFPASSISKTSALVWSWSSVFQ